MHVHDSETIYRLVPHPRRLSMNPSSSVSCARSNFTRIISSSRLLAVQPLVAVAGRSFRYLDYT